MSVSKTHTIPELFGASSKRLRVDAERVDDRINNPRPPLSEAAADEVFEKDIDGSTNNTEKHGLLVTPPNDLFPLPGFEPPLAPPTPAVGGFQQQESAPGEDDSGSIAEEGAGTDPLSSHDNAAPELTVSQKMRMELSKTVARSKRNVRSCEDRVAEARKLGKLIPKFEDLLVEQSWVDVLRSEFTKPYMTRLYDFVEREVAGQMHVYPPPALVFNAFNTCPFDRVKVVIIGQDPYHGPGQAMGLSFSVPEGIKVPPSLVNIFKEIRDDVGSTIPSHGNLEKWAQQGVLLLNAVLTVRAHNANSHAKKGWEPFTDAAIRAVSQKKKGIVFLLWGNSAYDKTRLIDTKGHHILKAPHPSGLSAHKGFFTCRHFSKTNEILVKAGKLPIDWQL